MKKKTIMKKLTALFLVAGLVITSSGMVVLAEDIQDEAEITTEITNETNSETEIDDETVVGEVTEDENTGVVTDETPIEEGLESIVEEEKQEEVQEPLDVNDELQKQANNLDGYRLAKECYNIETFNPVKDIVLYGPAGHINVYFSSGKYEIRYILAHTSSGAPLYSTTKPTEDGEYEIKIIEKGNSSNYFEGTITLCDPKNLKYYTLDDSTYKFDSSNPFKGLKIVAWWDHTIVLSPDNYTIKYQVREYAYGPAIEEYDKFPNKMGMYFVCISSTNSSYIGDQTAVIYVYEDNLCAHSYGAWKVKTPATALTEGQEVCECSLCVNQLKRPIAKLKPFVALNAKGTVPLQIKKSTTALKIASLADGDYVVSWTSSNPKVATVNSAGKITAKKKTGKAVITATMASGIKSSVTIKTQKKAVTPSKVNVNKKKVTLKVGETFNVISSVTPITAKQSIKYSTQKKRIATVSKKGVIKAKKAGTTKITVKAGKKKTTITVKVVK